MANGMMTLKEATGYAMKLQEIMRECGKNMNKIKQINYYKLFGCPSLAAKTLFELEASCPIIKYDEDSERAQDCTCENEVVGDCVYCVAGWLQEQAN